MDPLGVKEFTSRSDGHGCVFRNAGSQPLGVTPRGLTTTICSSPRSQLNRLSFVSPLHSLDSSPTPQTTRWVFCFTLPRCFHLLLLDFTRSPSPRAAIYSVHRKSRALNPHPNLDDFSVSIEPAVHAPLAFCIPPGGCRRKQRYLRTSASARSLALHPRPVSPAVVCRKSTTPPTRPGAASCRSYERYTTCISG
jgi:hypothetical protein